MYKKLQEIDELVGALEHDIFISDIQESLFDWLLDFKAYHNIYPENEKVKKMLKDLEDTYSHFIYLTAKIREFEFLIWWYPDKALEKEKELKEIEKEIRKLLRNFDKIADKVEKVRAELPYKRR